MGGYVTKAIRYPTKKGMKISSYVGWTNNMPFQIRSWILAGDRAPVLFRASARSTAADIRDLQGGYPIPDEYGLVFLDLPTQTLLHMQNYSAITTLFINESLRDDGAEVTSLEEFIAAAKGNSKSEARQIFDRGALRHSNGAGTEKDFVAFVEAEVALLGNPVDGYRFPMKIDLSVFGWNVKRFPKTAEGCYELLAAINSREPLSDEIKAAWKTYASGMIG
jgi:hypothetical protein